MGAHIGYIKLIMTTEAKFFYSFLSKNAAKNLEHEIGSVIKNNALLAEHK